MELTNIKSKIKEFLGLKTKRLELVSIDDKLEFPNNKFIFAHKEDDVYMFAAVGLECGTREYYCTVPIKLSSLKNIFADKIKKLEDVYFKGKEDYRYAYGDVKQNRFVYICGSKEDANKLRAHLKSQKADHGKSVTWLKAPNKAYSDLSFENLKKEVPNSRIIIIGSRIYEISTKSPDVIRRTELFNWQIKHGYDFVEIIPLGVEKDCSMFMSSYRNGVLKIPIGFPLKHILSLAPVKYWRDMDKFWKVNKRGEKEIDYSLIAEYLNELSAGVGTFDYSKFRGAGYFWNSKTNSLYARSGFYFVGEPPEGTHHFYGREIYEPKNSSGKFDKELFVELFNSFCWKEPVYGKVLLGWVLLAPFSGALNFRPHVWINGEKASGKTWIFENVILNMLEDCVAFTMGTTEAGLMRSLRGDALPVVHDEFETSNEKRKEDKAKLLEFFRGCSTSSGSKMSVTKCSMGSSSTVQSFNACSMVLLGSIKNSLEESQDAARFIVLSLSRLKRKKIFNEYQTMCEMSPDQLKDKFRQHVDICFGDFGRLKRLIEKNEKLLMHEYPDAVFHSLRCLAAIQSMLEFYSIPLKKEDVDFLVDKFKSDDKTESEKIISSIFLDEYWQHGHKNCLYNELIEAVRRRTAGKTDGVYDAALRQMGIKFEVMGTQISSRDVYVRINTKNKVFEKRIVEGKLPRNWRSILLEDKRVDFVSTRSILIKNVFNYLEGGTYENANSKGQEVD